MKGDFSRITFRREKHYVGTQLQQGRVVSDATRNEEQAIRQYHEEISNHDTIGASGAPRENAGFGLSINPSGELIFTNGRYYVNGVLVENDTPDMRFRDQLGITPNILAQLEEQGATIGLIYLEVWHRYISALHDDHIREKALGGPDDAGRIQTWWRVNLLPLTSVDIANIQPELDDLLRQRDDARASLTGGNLTSRTNARTAVDNLNEQINNLLASVNITCDTDFAELDQLIPLSTGRMMASSTDDVLPDADCSLPTLGGFQGLGNFLYNVMIYQGGTRSQSRFVYSRENGSVVQRISQFSGSEITLQSMGRDSYLGFSDLSSYDYVEIFNDETEAQGIPGELIRVTNVHQDLNMLELDNAPTLNTDLALNPKIRRWDQTQSQATPNGTMRLREAGSNFVELENGVRVEFETGLYRAGDHWVIPARTAPVSDVEWIPAGFHNAHGMPHHFAPLGLVYGGTGGLGLQVLTDCRNIFPPLTDITADDVSFDDSVCDLGADTVQEAIEALCGAQSGVCTITLTPNSDIQDALSVIGDGEDAYICLQVGNYSISQSILLENKGHLKIVGSGFGTRLIGQAGLEHVFEFVNCDSVTIRDLHAQTSATNVGDELGGTLEFRNCGLVTVEQTSLQCGHGVNRRAACIKILNSRTQVNIGRGIARIVSNNLRVGHLQTGFLLVNVPRAIVEDNLIQTYARPTIFGLRELAIANNFAYLTPIANTLLTNVMRANITAEEFVTMAAEPRNALNTGRFGDRIAIGNVSRNNLTINVPIRDDLDITVISPDPVLDERDWVSAINDERVAINDFELATDAGLYEVMRNVGRNILVNEGRVGAEANNWLTWFDRAVNDDQSVIGQGIVIGGTVAHDIRVLNNTIHTCIQGIHIGFSDRNTRNSFRSETMIIANNTISVSLPTAGVRERHGIFVGNTDSTLIENNYLTINRFATTSQLHIDAIRVWGIWGERLYVRGNHVNNQGSDSFTNGIRMNPENSRTGKRWLVADNIASVRLSGSFTAQVTLRDNVV